MTEESASPTENHGVAASQPTVSSAGTHPETPASEVSLAAGGKAPSNVGSSIATSPAAEGFPAKQGAVNDVRTFADEAKAIADGVTSIATHFASSRTAGWRAYLRRAKPLLVALPVLVGSLFALEQFLESHEEAESSRAEARFSATTEQLGSSQLAIQAAAVHALPRLATFRDVIRPQPGDYFPGAHLINWLIRSRREYPFMQRSWALFREFAAQPRSGGSIDQTAENVVSSAILQEGAAWELRRRAEAGPSDIATGALLFRANLPNAHGIHEDFRQINFGAVDLRNSNLSGSNLDDCGLSGARLEGAVLKGASFKGAYLADAKMAGTDFSFAHLDGADFERTDLKGAQFTETVLPKVDFAGAVLDKATFSQASASQAVFRNASLKGAVFAQTDVSDVVFEGADVDGADFTTSVGFSSNTLAHAKNGQRAHLPEGYAERRRKKLP